MTKRFIACSIFTLLCMTPPASAQTLEFQKVFEQHGIVMMLIDPNTGTIVDANPAAAQFYGHEREDLKTMTIQQINTLSAAQVADDRTLAQNEGRNYFIFRHRLADGEIRTVAVHSHPYSLDGQLLLLSLIHDITPGRNLEQGMWHYQQRLEELVEARNTEIKSKHLLITLILAGSLFIVSIIAIMLFRGRARRQQIELNLRQSEERYRLAQDATGVGIWDWDIVNDHLYWDDQMWAMISYPPDNRRVSYTDWCSLLHPEDLAGAEEEVQKQLHLGQGFVIEFRLRTRDGGWRWVQGRGKVVTRTDDGAPSRMMGTHTDIHEHKQAALELARSNEDLEQFAYVVSHDLRQPLRMVSSYMQLLEKQLDKQLDIDTRQMMHFAADGATRMNEMLVSLLEYSRVGRKNEPAEKLSSREILDEVLLFLRPAIDECSARIDINGDWPQIEVPRDEFTRLLQNLIDNAIKYRAAGQAPKITVEATVFDREYRFCIADKGIGIDPEQLPRLFKVFQRLHTREQYQGTGIGLAICRKIVERQGGRIWIESQGTGKGSCFCFTLPVPTAAGVQA